MRQSLALFGGIFLALSAAYAANVQFEVLPSDGAVQGPAGSTIGWGYQITNPDNSLYWIATDLESGSFGHATITSLFDFPEIAPNSSVEESFSAGLTGLFQLSWDASAPVGTTNQGVFTLSGDWYFGDPLNGGTFVGTGQAVEVSYLATVSDSGTGAPVVPEPGTRGLVLVGLLSLLWIILRRL